MSDYHELGGYQLWAPKRRVGSWLSHARYVDGPPAGFKALYGRNLNPPATNFFTEDLLTALEAGATWLRIPLGLDLDLAPEQVSAPQDYPTNCYVLEMWPDPTGKRRKNNITIEELIRRPPSEGWTA